MTATLDGKAEAVRQWSADPCGGDAAAGLPAGTRAYFERIDQNRYDVYAPWMGRVLPLDRAAGRDVLEVGCGLGSDLLRLARSGGRCHGIDLTPVHLALTADRFRLFAEQAGLAQADAEALPYAAASFDLVYSFGVIHHTPDTEQAVSEMHRVLRPGGVAWVALYHRNSAYFWLWLALVYGLLHGALFRRGWRGVLADIERREASDARPLVKLYTRSSAHRLFSRFRTVRISVHHLEPSHFPIVRRLVPFRLLKHLESRLGWYLVVQAVK